MYRNGYLVVVDCLDLIVLGCVLKCLLGGCWLFVIVSCLDLIVLGCVLKWLLDGWWLVAV